MRVPWQVNASRGLPDHTITHSVLVVREGMPGRSGKQQCAIRRRAVCSEGEYYATVSAHATFCSKERLYYRQVIRADGTDAADPVGRPTSGRKFGKLSPESPRLGGVEV